MKNRAHTLRVPVAALLFAAAGMAAAETSPWYIGVNQAFSYNSNVFRQIDEFAQSSWWSSTSLVGGFDQRQGRQRFYGTGNVAANVYGQVSQLDNTSYGVTAGWDWETIERLSGKLYASYNQSLANYGGFNVSIQNQKNIQDNALAYATVEYGIVSLVAADVRVAYSSVNYSLRSYAFNNLDQSSINARVRKQFSGQLTAGLGVAYTKGDYTSFDQNFDRYDLFVTGDWQATGQSTLSGRLGYSWSDYTGVNPYSQNGVTGWLGWAYAPTGKLNFNTRISYDTQANSVFTTVGGGSTVGLGQTQVLTSGLQFTANYAFSGKTSFNASLQFYQQKQDQNFGSGGPLSFDNTRNRVTSFALGATWLPSRNWQVNCNATIDDRNQSRSSSQPITLLPYSAYGGSCSAQFVFQ
jgi:hypothetical protein